MSVQRLRRRVRETGRRLRDLAYRRLAALFSCDGGPTEEAVVERLFRDLIDWEAAEGTALEAVLARLPQGLALELRRALSDALAAEGRAHTRP
jgi:hypothetical protein